MVGGFGLATGAISDRAGAAALVSVWGGGTLSFGISPATLAGRVRGSGGERRTNALVLTDPKLFLTGPMFGISAGGTGRRS
jgi:hypothetical protein